MIHDRRTYYRRCSSNTLYNFEYLGILHGLSTIDKQHTRITDDCKIMYHNSGLYSCLECITMVVSGVRGWVRPTSDSIIGVRFVIRLFNVHCLRGVIFQEILGKPQILTNNLKQEAIKD